MYLNPVRAGLVDDPKNYRCCGYSEALGGSKRARRGLCVILEMTVVTWASKAQETYRRLLLGEGIEASAEVKESESRQGRKYRRRGMNRALAALHEGKTLGKGWLTNSLPLPFKLKKGSAMEIFKIPLFSSALLCSLVAGFLFAFAVVVMPGIKTLGNYGGKARPPVETEKLITRR